MNMIARLNEADLLHCKRTAVISKCLAKLDGLGEPETTYIEQAALVHDIGKTAIPVEILNKPGPLTAEELAIVQTHTNIGRTLLKGTQNLMPTAATVAYQHHERLDGSGYHGLCGNDIHPHARLVAVADVFDALISKRSYKDPWNIGRACSYLELQAGETLDDHYVKQLVTHLSPIIYALEKMRENEEMRIRTRNALRRRRGGNHYAFTG